MGGLQTYIETSKWKNSTKVIKLTEQNGGKETTVEIPAGGVKLKIAAQEKPKKSGIPVRSHSSASSSSINSITGDKCLDKNPSEILISDTSYLFKKGTLKDSTQISYIIDKAKSWILISPELLKLVKDKKLIKDTDSREANALTYRKTEKIRLINLTEKEILILEENLSRLCESLKSNKKVNIFRN